MTAINSYGRFGIYSDMPSGIAPDTQQLLRYQDVYGLNTIRGIVSKWAPSSENDTASYIAQVSKAMGVGPDQPIDLHKQATAAALVEAMARRETGQSIDQTEVAKGVAMALGGGTSTSPPIATAQGAPAPAIAQGAPVPGIAGGTGAQSTTPIDVNLNGGADIKLTMQGFPDNVMANTTTTGNVFGGAPKVSQFMPLLGGT